MKTFNGFTDSENFTRLPDTFFQHLLTNIDTLAELKVTLYALWAVEHVDSTFRALCKTDFENAETLSGLAQHEIEAGLTQAVRRGTLILSVHEADAFYFLNSPRGRAAAQAFAAGDWRASAQIMDGASIVERPNVYKLYEENIGPLTPIIADSLRDAEETYPAAWLQEAIEAAVKRNARNWKYVQAILNRWKEEGRDAQEQDRRDPEKDRRKYTEGKYADFIE